MKSNVDKTIYELLKSRSIGVRWEVERKLSFSNIAYTPKGTIQLAAGGLFKLKTKITRIVCLYAAKPKFQSKNVNQKEKRERE